MTVLSAWLFGETRTVAGGHPVLVTIDPGHGGIDPGAVGAEGQLEKHWNLQIAQDLALRLRSSGLAVLMTRSGDRTLSRPYSVRQELINRAGLANRAGSWIFLSIHLNVESTGRVSGPIVYYQAGNPAAHRLASDLEAALASVSQTRHPPRPSHLMLLMLSRMPTVIVELGFLSHPADRARLGNTAYRAELAAALARGILTYLRR
ncbi:MAG: N-acetylmuramoyl-L-alanine amidase family protein [Clostridia bacterium]